MARDSSKTLWSRVFVGFSVSCSSPVRRFTLHTRTDRRAVTWDPNHPLDPALFRHRAHPGDFELESLQLEDVLVTVYQPGAFRPYTASIFRADVRTFRKQWMFYDFLSAENIVGQFDNCLFSLHKPQSIGRTNEQDLLDGKWARMVGSPNSEYRSMLIQSQSRLRIDGVNIDHIQAATTEGGPMSWIKSGKVDAVLDIKFPHDTGEDVFDAIFGEIADAITTATTSLSLNDRIPGQRQLAKPPLTAPSDVGDDEQSQKSGSLIIDIDLRFRDLKAAVPIFTNDLSYVNNAAVRPIVAFMK
jgi:distribution and morphology protein 31